MNILVSACLLGVNCRYSGKRAEVDYKLKKLIKKHNLIPVCPEIFGGLPTPREPAEINGERVKSTSGKDFTDSFLRGAGEVLRLAELFECRYALLKERSPSCGHGRIYDGTFSSALTDGDGICAKALSDAGIRVFGESEIDELILLCDIV